MIGKPLTIVVALLLGITSASVYASTQAQTTIQGDAPKRGCMMCHRNSANRPNPTQEKKMQKKSPDVEKNTSENAIKSE